MKRYQFVDRVVEFSIYLYIVFMFLTKGEGIRNVLIFGSFGLWLLTLKYRKNTHILKEPVAKFFWIYLGSIIFSVIFSIDPLYSLNELRGEPLKSALLFPVVATVMADEVRLKRMIHVIYFTSIFIVLIGFYSYFTYDIPMLKPHTPLMHAWHNKFAKYLNTLFPFSFILFFLWDKKGFKLILISSLILSLLALILSTSRGGYLAFFSMAYIWAVYLSRKKGYNFKKVMASIMMIIFMVGALSWFSSPYLRERISRVPADLSTFNLRTHAWVPAIYAFAQRPLFGWGYGDYGSRLFYRDEPHRETPHKKAPAFGIENTFIKILFHQGIVGIIPYILLIFVAIKCFWKEAFKTPKLRSYLIVSCVSVLVGNYIVHSLLAVFVLHHLAVILGLGMAAKAQPSENSNP